MGGSRQRLNVAQWTEATKDVLPQRLGSLAAVHRAARPMTDFYTQVLGLRVSDTIHHDLVTFLNAGPGDHHIFGFIASTHRGFHHASFEVPSIDAIAIGADRMRAQGREAGWGLGRHTIGSNFFHYNPDPWGSWIEWFSDIDQIDDCWVANDWDVPPHLWGTPPPETFLEQPRRAKERTHEPRRRPDLRRHRRLRRRQVRRPPHPGREVPLRQRRPGHRPRGRQGGAWRASSATIDGLTHHILNV